MNSNVRQYVEEWVQRLSPETIKNIENVLSVVITQGEALDHNPFGIAVRPVADFHFERKGIPDDLALNILKTIESKISQELVVGTQIGISTDLLEDLKEIWDAVRDRPEKRVSIKENRNFPHDLKWQEIRITFLNKHDVLIKYRDEQYPCRYDVMGFQDNKTGLPNSQWELLHILALSSSFISWDTNMEKDIKDNLKKRKQLLSKGLKEYFHIKDDPFYSYKEEKGYRIKLTLIPDNTDDAPIDKFSQDIQGDFRQQTPGIYEE